MKKAIASSLFFLILGSCSVLSSSTPPRNLDNACAIVQQKPNYLRAFKATERKWGVPVHVQMAIIHQESRFRSNAKTPMRYFLGVIPRGRQSSAFGYAQALDGTWEEYKAKTGRFIARRSNIRDATDFMGWYMNNTRQRNGIALSDTKNQYLAYHEGQTGFARGSHRRKSWLLNVANKVKSRASMYNKQLRQCGRV